MSLQYPNNQWIYWNAPEKDCMVLYDLILKNGYTNALEIGTSTGRSAIWIARALNKTGGKLITIEIDKGRYDIALKNFKQEGLNGIIDARLADAHRFVLELKTSFDFVFSDADKDWYTNYFVALSSILKKGGCYTAHNVLWTWNSGIKKFLDYVQGLSNFSTTINKDSQEGISISYKTSK